MGSFRPCKDEFDVLEEVGNKGWNWESLLTYMKKVMILLLLAHPKLILWSLQSETAFPSNLSPEESRKFAVTSDLSPHGTQGTRRWLQTNWY